MALRRTRLRNVKGLIELLESFGWGKNGKAAIPGAFITHQIDPQPKCEEHTHRVVAQQLSSSWIFGAPAGIDDIAELRKWCVKHDIPLIEGRSQSIMEASTPSIEEL